MASPARSLPSIVILPGLDGTGLMLEDFCAALTAEGVATQIIAYPPDRLLDYEALQAYVLELLPQDDFILLGESFSGPIALRIAASEPPGLKAVVLAASFARFDFPLKRLFAAIIGLFPPAAAPAAMLDRLLMNGLASAGQKRRVKAALATVNSDVLRLRMREAVRVDLDREGVRVRLPVLHLRATGDRLMRRSSGNGIMKLGTAVSIAEIPAPHFILQFASEACAQAVCRFRDSLQ